MTNSKRFYWLKLKEDFFDDPAIDWIKEQENGAEYILIYQMLCLRAMNANGILSRTIGDMIVPYEPKKIAEITKSKIDVVVVALELFKKTGLLEVLDTGEFYLRAVKEMTGTETNWAEYKRLQRDKQKKIGQCPKSPMDKVQQENRDIDIRDKEIKSIDKRKREVEVDSINNNPPLSPLVPSGENETLFDPELEAKFLEWVRYKKEQHRFSYKPVSLKSLRSQIERHLESHTPEQIVEIIDLSIASGYKGILFDMLDAPRNSQSNKSGSMDFVKIAQDMAKERGE